MTRVTSRSEPLFQSVRVRLRFASTEIIRFSSGSLFAILKNTVRARLRFDKNSVKPVYKTAVRVRFDSLVSSHTCLPLRDEEISQSVVPNGTTNELARLFFTLSLLMLNVMQGSYKYQLLSHWFNPWFFNGAIFLFGGDFRIANNI